MILNIFNFVDNNCLIMIQRIQTLYLFIATCLMAALFFFPFAKFIALDGNLYIFNFTGIFQEGDASGTKLGNPWPVTVLICLSLILTIFTIFQFKGRTRQIKLAYLDILILLSTNASIYFYAWSGNKLLGASFHLTLFSGLPLMAILFVILAIRNIRKDENLVKSIDRIR